MVGLEQKQSRKCKNILTQYKTVAYLIRQTWSEPSRSGLISNNRIIYLANKNGLELILMRQF